MTNYHETHGWTVSDLREGDIIRHIDGEARTISRVGHHVDEFGPATDLSFEGDGVIPFAVRDSLGERFTKLIPFPVVGDKATLHFPSDSYPFEVVKVSPAGAKIWLRPLAATIVSGSFQTGDAVIEYASTDHAPRTASWSIKRRRYLSGGSPISIGHARFYQAPEV